MTGKFNASFFFGNRKRAFTAIVEEKFLKVLRREINLKKLTPD
jgi:hypothetical protein